MTWEARPSLLSIFRYPTPMKLKPLPMDPLLMGPINLAQEILNLLAQLKLSMDPSLASLLNLAQELNLLAQEIMSTQRSATWLLVPCCLHFSTSCKTFDVAFCRHARFVKYIDRLA
mmetsp:Transcript_30865/g.52363  ORF Transcript_30865/g.52363 Transcript_30865/m.52363 type:complete len:116 (-) Transcript_30865:100-447(-)